MEKILTESNRIPQNIQSDIRKEFYKKTFQTLMNKYNINHYSTFRITKAAIAERVIRTLKKMLYKEFSLCGKYKWSDILNKVTHKYNNRIHQTIYMKPNK